MSLRKLLKLVLALGLALGGALPAAAQPATQRTPNMAGSWITPPGMLFFDFLHRFEVGSPPTYAVTNVPNFHLSTGFGDWLALGAQYATETRTVPGASQELELFAKQRFMDQGAGAPMSLSIKEAFNLTAWSPDAELGIAREIGPLSLFGTLRGMGNYRFSGSPQAAVGLGASWAMTPALGLAADVAGLPLAPSAGLVWGAGAQVQIPASPHTLSLQVTNTGTDTIQGSSVATGALRYGFSFSVPFSNAGQWLGIFQTAAKAPEEKKAAPGKATPAPAAFRAEAFFASRCAGCHGAEGQGGFGPDLRGAERHDDAFVATRIMEGSPKGMPPFAGQLSDAELAELVHFVKRL